MKAILISAAALCALGAAAVAPLRGVTPDGRAVTVEAVTDNIFRVSNLAPGETLSESKVTEKPASEAQGTLADNGGLKVLTTASGLRAIFDTANGSLTISDRNRNGLYDSGRRTTDDKGRRATRLVPLGGADSFYGAGERGHSFNLAGDTLVMCNRQNYGYTASDPRISQMNISMPLLVSPEGYAVLFDDFAAADLAATSPLVYSSESPEPVSYYFVSSPDGFEGVAEQLTSITGRQPLPPFWSLGYITSKYGYKTRREAEQVVDSLKTAGYPVDGMVLDLYWYGKEQDMGRLDWDPEQWPAHEKMLRDLKKKGVNMVAITQPYVLRNGRGLDNYNYLASNGMLAKDSLGNPAEVKIWVGEGGMIDVSNPDAARWYRETYRRLTDQGMGGWWGDLGEPEVHPEGFHHANGLTTRQYHNLYGNHWSRIIAALYSEEYRSMRLMTLMRGGTTGLQRYSVFPWSTDVSRSWGGLRPQVTIMLGAGQSGLGYMSHDVGGFAVDPGNPVDPELYVRWLQLGLFSPVLRTHSQHHAEPYLYPDHQDIILPLVKARYSWLPYNYTLAYENAAKGLPLVRPVGTYSPDPAAYDHITDQYLWGRDVMVAPVLEQGATSRPVTFPEGRWIDYDAPLRSYSGPADSVMVEAPLATIPLFVRAGAIIPSAPYAMRNVADYDPSRYTLDYYPSSEVADSRCEIYEDDRSDPRSLPEGRYALLTVSASNTPEAYTFTVSATPGAPNETPNTAKEAPVTSRNRNVGWSEPKASGSPYPGCPAKRRLTFVLHNVDAPASVSLSGGRALKGDYTPSTRTLSVALPSSTLPLTLIIRK